MVHLDYFLGCAKIETGGFFIAWFHIIVYPIFVFLITSAFLLGVYHDRHEIEKLALTDDQIIDTYEPSSTFLALLAVFMVVICIVIVVIAIRSIHAIKIRSHVRMFEMMALLFAITCLVLYIIAILIWLWPIYCLPAVIVAVFYYYLFLVVYSLYRVFRKEYELKVYEQQKASA